MGKHFGELYKLHGIVTYIVSPFELKAFGNFGHCCSNMGRRMAEEFLYVVPPLLAGYLTYELVERRAHAKARKNPADYADEH